MPSVSHEEQQRIWEDEHQNPKVLLQMDSRNPSSGVVKFLKWLKDNEINPSQLTALEMACGKGRNVVWLAEQGIEAPGVDFSPSAIKEANRRAKEADVAEKAHFLVHDVSQAFPFDNESFDIAIDCFGSTDLESRDVRQRAATNLERVLKVGGYLLMYMLSVDDEFHREMIAKYTADEPNSFLHPETSKFEKAFTEDEVKELHNDLTVITIERVPKTTEFFGKEYDCDHIWVVFQK